MPINALIPLQAQRPKIMGPADILSLKSLAQDYDLKRLEKEALMRDKERSLQADQSKRRITLSEEANTRAYNAAQLAKSRGAAPEVVQQMLTQTYLETIEDQCRRGDCSLAGISEAEIANARAKPPTFEQLQAKVLKPEHTGEMAEYAQLAQPGGTVPMSQIGQQPVAPPQQQIPTMQPSGAITQPDIGVRTEQTPEGVPLSEVDNIADQFQEVTAPKAVITPDQLRLEAQRLRRIATKPALALANQYMTQAKELDDQIFKERERRKPVAGAPGVVFDESNHQFYENDKPVSAARVQEIAEKQRKAGATNINLAESKYAEKFGGKVAEADVDKFEAATAASENIEKLDTVIDHLETSDAITGLGSEFFKDMQRAQNLVMGDIASGKKVSDTELLDAFLGSDVFPMIKALGIGARGLDTPAEREFLRSVMTGTTAMNKQTLLRLTRMRRDIAARAADKWNARLKSIPAGVLEGAGITRDPIIIPPPKKYDKGPVKRPKADEFGDPELRKLLDKYK